MEGRLKKYSGFFSGSKEYKYILHEGMLHEYDIETNVETGTIHMLISSVSVNAEKPLEITINNGMSQIVLQAEAIKDKVEWVNALNESKLEIRKIEEERNEKQNTEVAEKMNDVLATNIFSKFDPLYQKIGKIWSVQAQFQEVMSLMEPELNKNKRLKTDGEKLADLANQMKESVAEVLGDLEIARKEFALALNRFSEVDEAGDYEESDDDLKSLGSLRSVKIDPKSFHNEANEMKDWSDEEEKIDTTAHFKRSISKINPREIGEEIEIRKQLPAFKDPERKFSLWALISDNIGQDLTKVTLPIILNEPVSMLQKCCESMMNFKMLEDACAESDPYMRMAYAAWFTTVQYCSIDDRALKPFNPLLGETYEYVWKDFKFLAEQVSHHPPITACHAYGRGYEMWTHSDMKSKFWGTSLEFIPLGKAYYIINDEHYVGSRPSTVAWNIIFGTTYLELWRDTITTWPQTGAKWMLTHKEKGWGGRNAYVFEGFVYNDSEEKVLAINGLWNEYAKVTNLETKEETIIWEREPRADNHIDQYGLTRFAITMNNLTERLKKLIGTCFGLIVI